MFYFEEDKDYIKITFNRLFYNHFKELYFLIDNNFIYYDNSHLNYIYEEKIENIKYTFYGFYKDNFFVIIMNSYNIDLDINIEHKFIILLELDWIIKKYSEDKSIWCIDKSKINNLKINGILLPSRNKFLNYRHLNLDDYIKITEYENIKINISIINKKENTNFFKKIYSLLKF